MGSNKRRPANRRSKPFPLVPVAIGVVVILAVLAWLGSRGNSGAELEVSPVTVTGSELAPPPDSGTDPEIGATAPGLAGSSFDDSAVRIESDGRPKLVVFLAHWCPHCQREVPRLVEWLEGGNLPEGIDMYGIATATNAGNPNYPPSEWLERENFNVPVMVDSEDQTAAGAYGANAYPFFVMLDGDMAVLARDSGELTIDELESVLALATP